MRNLNKYTFEPDYRHIEQAARNQQSHRLPLYEHIICKEMMESILGVRFSQLKNGNHAEKAEYFKHYCDFFRKMGYDTVSYEECIGPVMPASGALGGHVDPVIKTREDFERYPWAQIPDWYFERYSENLRLSLKLCLRG